MSSVVINHRKSGMMMKCFLYLMFLFLPSLVAWQLFTSTRSFLANHHLSLTSNKRAAVDLSMKHENKPKNILTPILSFGLGSLLLTANPPEPSTLRQVAVAAVVEEKRSTPDTSTVAAVSIFTGRYSDPNHPKGFREITATRGKDGNVITIRGSDSERNDQIWTLQAVERKPGEVVVDFSPKGGPKDLLGVYDESIKGIKWPDGNRWTKLP